LKEADERQHNEHIQKNTKSTCCSTGGPASCLAAQGHMHDALTETILSMPYSMNVTNWTTHLRMHFSMFC
jgi:hypothetical protein